MNRRAPPVDRGRGFVLHTADWVAGKATLAVPGGYAMTATQDILEALAKGGGPAHALLALGRPDEALHCLRELPGGVAPDHPYLMSMAMALQHAARHAEAVPLFLQALALKIDDPFLHFHLGTSFKQLCMKAEAAECVRTGRC